MANSRLYPIAAAAEQLCILQAAAAALQWACARAWIKRVRARACCSKALSRICNTGVFCLRAVTVLASALMLLHVRMQQQKDINSLSPLCG